MATRGRILSCSGGPRLAGPTSTAIRLELLRFRPLRIFFVKTQMPVVHRRELSPDKEVLDVGGEFERVAVGDDEVGKLALFDGPDLIIQAENPRGINRHGLERFLIWQAVRDGVGDRKSTRLNSSHT